MPTEATTKALLWPYSGSIVKKTAAASASSATGKETGLGMIVDFAVAVPGTRNAWFGRPQALISRLGSLMPVSWAGDARFLGRRPAVRSDEASFARPESATIPDPHRAEVEFSALQSAIRRAIPSPCGYN